MARARIITEVVRRPTRVRLVHLILTEGEADYMLATTARSKGDEKNSPVKYARRIHAALASALNYDYPSTDAGHLITGYLKFHTYDKLKDRRLTTIKALRDEVRASMDQPLFPESIMGACCDAGVETQPDAYATGGVTGHGGR